jgi:hypothetical protein
LNRTTARIRDHDGSRILTLTDCKNTAELDIGVHLAEIVAFPGFPRGGWDQKAFAEKHRLTSGRSDAHERSDAGFFTIEDSRWTLHHKSGLEAESKIEKGPLRANAAIEFFTFHPFVENVLELPRRLRVERKLRPGGSQQREE